MVAVLQDPCFVLPQGSESLVKLLCGKNSHASLVMSSGALLLCHVKVLPWGVQTEVKK